MSGRATLTTVTSSNSMNVAIETRTRVHHLRSMARNPKEPTSSADQADQGRRERRVLCTQATEDAEMRRSDGEVPELLANAPVEARARQLRQPADRVDEADLERGPGPEVGDLAAIDGDFDRLAIGRVEDVEDVAGRDDQGPRRQRVRRDVADHVPLHPPGQDRALVGEVVAGRSRRGGGDEAVAADVADLLPGDPVAELGDAVMEAPGEGDVV